MQWSLIMENGFWIGQTGITLEMIGAGILLWRATREHQVIFPDKGDRLNLLDIESNYDLRRMLDQVKGRKWYEVLGFLALALGLSLQLIGNLLAR